ncbi:MAG: Piwi domain-containing protein [Candidatus Thorarchaeota archaeon]
MTKNSLVDMFPVQPGIVPKLRAFKLFLSSGDLWTIGGKLGYRLNRELEGQWTWTSHRLITDSESKLTDLLGKINEVVETLWKEQPEIYGSLQHVDSDSSWKANPKSIADFARSICNQQRVAIDRLLMKERTDLGEAYVDRYHRIGSWVVENAPSISIEVKSRIVSSSDFRTYVETVESIDELVGLWVGDSNSDYKGEITSVVGKLKDERKRLLSRSQNPDTRAIIHKAPADDIVVTVTSGRKSYDYTASALKLIVRLDYLDRFGIRGSEAIRALRIDPESRQRLVWRIAALLRMKEIIAFAYDSTKNPGLFDTATNFGYKELIQFGDGHVDKHDPRTIMRNLRIHGLHRISRDFESGQPIRAFVVNSAGKAPIDRFLSKIDGTLSSLGFSLDILGREDFVKGHRLAFERSVLNALDKNPDVVLSILPDYQAEYEGWLYQALKMLTVGRGTASQGARKRTLDNDFAIDNIVLGILGKTGNIPFILGNPISDADMVVGIDIAREKKRRLDGSLNAAAMARVYFGNGEFVRYHIQDAPLEGETIPVHVLQNMFRSDEFEGKRVIIHRDGWFRGDEKSALSEWGNSIDAEFHLVDVVKTGSPRMYSVGHTGPPPKNVSMPTKGDLFRLDSRNAFLISSLPPFKNATPQPLQIRVDGKLNLERGIESVLKLTCLHYGSLRPPKLPVTTHYADKISYMVLRGIKPPTLEGNKLFWL